MLTKSWIKNLREKKGLTQKQASDLFFVHERTWRRWELKGAQKHIEELIKIKLSN
jgi:transcriptional regulator with XRE-family HTH domain